MVSPPNDTGIVNVWIIRYFNVQTALLLKSSFVFIWIKI